MASLSAKTTSAPARHPLPAEPPRVGDMLAALRQARALSLDELSRLAGVSKSMLSQIERAQANPTVAVVWRLANALGAGPYTHLRAHATKANPVCRLLLEKKKKTNNKHTHQQPSAIH